MSESEQGAGSGVEPEPTPEAAQPTTPGGPSAPSAGLPASSPPSAETMRLSVPAWGGSVPAAEYGTVPAISPGTGTVPGEGAGAASGVQPGAGPATLSANGPGAAPDGRWQRFRVAFRAWRRSRPFWGGLLVLLGAAEILGTYRAPFGMVLHFGLYGLAGYLVPAMLALLGALIIFDPPHRTFYSILAVLAALATWMTSNLGGFVVGMLLGVVGGSLAFGWQVGERPARKRRRVRAGATG